MKDEIQRLYDIANIAASAGDFDKYKEYIEMANGMMRESALKEHITKHPSKSHDAEYERVFKEPKWITKLNKAKDKVSYGPLKKIIDEVLDNYNKDNSYEPSAEVKKEMNLLFKTFT